jgi:hypothetical protein
MIASGTYPTGVIMAPFWYVEEVARKGKFMLIAYGAYNAMGLIGPEKGGVALVDEKAYQVIGTKDVPYNPRGRHELLLRVESSPDWVNAAASAGFDMRFSHYTNPGRRNPGAPEQKNARQLAMGAIGIGLLKGAAGVAGSMAMESMAANPRHPVYTDDDVKRISSLLAEVYSLAGNQYPLGQYINAARDAYMTYGDEGLWAQLLYIMSSLRATSPRLKELKTALKNYTK